MHQDYAYLPVVLCLFPVTSPRKKKKEEKKKEGKEGRKEERERERERERTFCVSIYSPEQSQIPSAYPSPQGRILANRQFYWSPPRGLAMAYVIICHHLALLCQVWAV
jgi:hypothetical protein